MSNAQRKTGLDFARRNEVINFIAKTKTFSFIFMVNFSLVFVYFRSSNLGNFLEILHWASTTDPVVKSIFEDSTGNASYLSHDVQNELINLMANQVRGKISSMVRQAYVNTILIYYPCF